MIHEINKTDEDEHYRDGKSAEDGSKDRNKESEGTHQCDVIGLG